MSQQPAFEMEFRVMELRGEDLLQKPILVMATTPQEALEKVFGASAPGTFTDEPQPFEALTRTLKDGRTLVVQTYALLCETIGRVATENTWSPESRVWAPATGTTQGARKGASAGRAEGAA